MKKIFLCCDPQTIHTVYSDTIKAKLGYFEPVVTLQDLEKKPKQFCDTEYIFSTWGMPCLSEEQIKTIFPVLKAVFYAAGSVQEFARPFLECGVKVFSGWAANAIPVAEYTVAQIILANKGFFPLASFQSNGRLDQAVQFKVHYKGNFDGKVGIIGAGMIGSLVIQMLQSYRLEALVFDPFLSEEKARLLGAKKVELDELFATCNVISNHLANNQQTQRMLDYSLFQKMPPYASFINTGRGAQVVEEDLVKLLRERPDVYALLDVTMPEPPVSGHSFYQLENCILTPHLAGSSGDEVHRMAEYIYEDYVRFSKGEPCRYEVTEQMLRTMA